MSDLLAGAMEQRDVTTLLQAWGRGNKDALNELMPIVYGQLHKLAAHCLHSERREHTLRATALVSEAYVRLVQSDVAPNDRMHFYALASRVLRRILVDHAKSHRREKRGGGAEQISLDEALVCGGDAPAGLIELDEALERLAHNDQRKAHLVELLYFGGLTREEAAEALNVSPSTVDREMKMAKAWLYRELK